MTDKVPTAPLREAFLRSGLTAYSVAAELGWFSLGRRLKRADAQRVRRALGVAPTTVRGIRYYNKNLKYDTALAIVRVLNLDPIDFGL